MKWPVYLFFALFSIVLAVISMFFWMINPVTPLCYFWRRRHCGSWDTIRRWKGGRRSAV
jgi:hypothetical protein